MSKENHTTTGLIRETVGDQVYEFHPLGDHVVCAPGFCGGRPTFKYTRVEVAGVLELLSTGLTIEEIVADYGRPEISREAMEEALRLAAAALAAERLEQGARAA